MSSPISPRAQFIASDDGPWAQVRTGTVTSQDATSTMVLVGGTQIPAAYGVGAVYEQGDLVALIRQDASWLVLFRLAGAGPNEIQNLSFEMSPTGIPPVLWFLADISGLAQSTVIPLAYAPDGDQAAQIISDSATSSSYLYSSPIAVTAGEVFNVSAYVTGIYDVDAPQTADAAIVGLWFADADDLYPTTISADIVIEVLNDVPSGPPFVQLSGSVTAPVSGFMRVALRSNLAVGQSLAWDFVTARRVT